jgi:acyl-CoA synthetase (AMP-forming)/AMP-acid ligase II
MAAPPTALAAPPKPGRLDTLLPDLVREQSAALGRKTYLAAALGDDGGAHRELSYRALAHAVAGWTSRFDAMGVAAGATVGLAIADPIDFAVVFLSLIASGRWAAPLDPALPPHGMTGLVAALERVEAAAAIADRPAPRGSDLMWWPLEGDAVALAASDARAEWGSPRAGGGTVLASSGTTGAPKVVPLGQEQLLHTARAIAEHHRFTPADRGFNPLPLFHINAEVVGLLAALTSGACLVLDDRFHRTDFWRRMAEQRITWINAVPAIVSRLSELRSGEAVPPGIRFLRSASAPLPTRTLRAFEDATSIPVVETYGMTEAASQITANPIDGPRKPGSVGRPVGVELRIVGSVVPEEHTAVPARARSIGNVEIRGPSVITAYGGGRHRDRFDADGWLRTGDLGHLDADGYLYLDARVDDVINRGGEKIYPREIEELLLIDPGIVAASVVGQADPVFGQVPLAYLVVKPELAGTVGWDSAPAVLERCRRRLEAALVRSQRPVSLRVVSELPSGAMGKVQRRALREHPVAVLHHLDCP